ncbi:hypothetical protein [Methylobacterium symbioticum]|uniref:Uncharacterized protein n=1 Tax=Methylobacterium symbioticum TaxID=2584084 RepID=A0A509E633_9HYPH|nr:hypothetical protein [Methylobacterium symbioticum]VUD69677.1 hypothetical protein MET9862_00232 [Methylobacterium symbioticum]
MVEKLNNEEARQGERGKPVLWVLLASLALLVVATIGLLTWNGANAPKDYASQSQDAARQEVTGSVSGQSNAPSSANSGGTPAANPAYPAKSQPSANPNQPK